MNLASAVRSAALDAAVNPSNRDESAWPGAVAVSERLTAVTTLAASAVLRRMVL
jgi:hypothetical protein